MMIALLLAAAAASPAPLQTRCGWLQNPTPGNWWLVDRSGQWILSTQGREPVRGWDTAPKRGQPRWVKTNGDYGYSCACAQMRVDAKSRDVREVTSVTYRPLAVCRADRRLPKP